MSEENSGMKPTNSRKLSTKPMRKDSSAKMLVAVAMTLMYMYTQVLVLIFVERRQV